MLQRPKATSVSVVVHYTIVHGSPHLWAYDDSNSVLSEESLRLAREATRSLRLVV